MTQNPIVTVCNPSAYRQTRWVDFALPISAGMPLNPYRLGGHLAVPGRQIGKHSQMWHWRVELEPGQVLKTAEWLPTAWDTADAPWPALNQNTLDLLRLVPSLIVTHDGNTRSARCTSARIVYGDKAQMVWRLELHAAGWHLVCFATAWAWQSAIDVSGMVVWCDQTTPEWSMPNTTVELSWGCPATLYGAKKQGLTQTGEGTWTLWQGQVVDGVGLPFRGVVQPVPQDDVATDSPLYATAVWPDGTWLAFGNRPDVPPATRQRMDDLLQQTGTLADQRPGANNLAVGSTGDQACFGATKGLGAAGGNPWALRELLWAGDDWILRGGHYYSVLGAPITAASHPGWQTFGQVTEHNASDTLGKSKTQPWGWDRMGARYIGGDDQHRGDLLTLASYALTGDWLLLEDLKLRLNADEVRAKTLRGTLDEPRAGGRLWLSWANMALLMDAADQQRLRGIALKELDMRINAWPHTSPVRPEDITVDNRVLPGKPAWIAWKEGLCCLGAWAQHRVWERLGDAQMSGWFQDFARELATTVVDWGTFKDKDGQWLITTGCLWLEGGVANPPSYYTFPRPGASYGPDPGIDMMVGGGGWLDWCTGAWAAVDSEKAKQVWTEMCPPAGSSENKLSWWAIR